MDAASDELLDSAPALPDKRIAARLFPSLASARERCVIAGLRMLVKGWKRVLPRMSHASLSVSRIS
jgi:hypothetical protein